jgi:two-component system, cell cycle sensor histidine kinase DivJ
MGGRANGRVELFQSRVLSLWQNAVERFLPLTREGDAYEHQRRHALMTYVMMQSLFCMASLVVIMALGPQWLQLAIGPILVLSMMPIAGWILHHHGKNQDAGTVALGIVCVYAISLATISASAVLPLAIIITSTLTLKFASDVSGERSLLIAGTSALIALGYVPYGETATHHGLTAWLAVGAIMANMLSGLFSMAVGRPVEQVSQSRNDVSMLIQEQLSDIVLMLDKKADVLWASGATHTILEVSSPDMMAHGLLSFVHLHDRPAVMSTLLDARDRAGESFSLTFRMRKAGHVSHARGHDFVWVEMRCKAMPQLKADPENVRIVASISDVSARMAHQEMLEQARDEAQRASQSKGQFMAMMSHELRTPLNSIIGFADMLKEAERFRLGEPQRKEYAEIIHTSGEHLLGIVEALLDLAKLESRSFQINVEPFDVSKVAQSVTKMLGMRAEQAGINLTSRVAIKADEWTADPRAVKQITVNLLSNALKFTKSGGSVALDIQKRGHHAVISVEDDGVGIASEEVKRLCEPFFQASSGLNRSNEGTGLGLAIVKGLVELHGGRLHIQSELGKGTRVSAFMPLTGPSQSEQIENIESIKPASEREKSKMPARKQGSVVELKKRA